MGQFIYEQAFSRNLGWLTDREQAALRGSCVAIAGLGGVGGSHLLTLTRLGIGAFHIADFDTFDQANFNRQVGASLSSLDHEKVDVLARMALDINPELRLEIFREGVTAANLTPFLDGVDIYVDGLDFFAFGARQLVFPACSQRGIPATTVAPLGMGAALLNFLPGRMSFEDYFCWKGCSEEEMALRFLIGLSPAMLHRHYLVEPEAVDFRARKGPSTAMACELCAGIAATEVLKILLGRGPVSTAPRGIHFDAYRNQLVRTWRPWGNRNPIQRLMLWYATQQLSRSKLPTGRGAR